MKTIQIKFEGIDSFHRAVFKALDSKERFGCVCILFDRDSSEETVLKYINEGDLCYFGNSFDCEPMGTAPGEIEIVSFNRENNMKTKKIYLEVEVPERVDMDSFITHKKLHATDITQEVKLYQKAMSSLQEIDWILTHKPKNELALLIKQDSEIVLKLIETMKQYWELEKTKLEARKVA